MSRRLLLDDRRRPGALLRVLAFLAAAAALQALAGILAGALLGERRGTPGEIPAAGGFLALGMLRLLPLLGATWFATSVLDRRPLSSVGIVARAPAGRQVLLGLAAGAAPPLVYAAVLGATGHLAFSAPPDLRAGALAATALAFALAAGGEELLVRGYLLQAGAQAFGPSAAVLLTGAAFGLLHGRNPGIGPIGVAQTVVIGVLLGWIVIRTASLWAAIAFHAAWNVTGSLVLGLTLSGLRPETSLLRSTAKGPELLTGGAFGFEASAVTLAAMLAALAAAIACTGDRLRHGDLATCYRRRRAGP